MVGRIVVGRPGGPGTRPADYFTGQSGTQDWFPVPDAARRSFPPVDVILRQRVVRREALPAGHGSRHRGAAPPRRVGRAYRRPQRDHPPIAGGRRRRGRQRSFGSRRGALVHSLTNARAPWHRRRRGAPVAPAHARRPRGRVMRTGAVLLLVGWSLLSPAASRAETPADRHPRGADLDRGPGPDPRRSHHDHRAPREERKEWAAHGDRQAQRPREGALRGDSSRARRHPGGSGAGLRPGGRAHAADGAHALPGHGHGSGAGLRGRPRGGGPELRRSRVPRHRLSR